MGEDVRAKLIEAVKKLDTVMLTTAATDGTMHARPMAVADAGEGGEIWFVTGKQSEKTHEAASDSAALVTGQQGSLYLTLNGRVEVVEDRARIKALWREPWRAWFPDGVDDPGITLLRLRPEHGEYWDNTGTKGVRYLFEAAKAVIEGTKMDTGGKEHHAKVAL
ncbi:MAG: ral stress protein 26 [Labilithrix sp.]|nr:ral stress protein 26 [Labilithrix sp.]